jgi:hypothetical protein
MPFATNISDPHRFEAAGRKFDEANARDPNTEVVEGRAQPRELVYAQRLTAWVLRLRPEASEALQLAARCQHLCRWMIPRETYPLTRAGYLRWREDLKRFHADRAGAILREVGYPDEVVQRVRALNLKRDVGQDAECQTLEDALCLVFLQFQLAELVRKTEEPKVVNALQKAWRKMSRSAQAEALALRYPPIEKALLDRALAGVEPRPQER